MLRRLRWLAIPVVAAMAVAGFSQSGSAGPTGKPVDRQELARHLLKLRSSQYLTGPARSVLTLWANGDKSLTGTDAGHPAEAASTTSGGAPLTTSAAPRPPANVRVNNQPLIARIKIRPPRARRRSLSPAGTSPSASTIPSTACCR